MKPDWRALRNPLRSPRFVYGLQFALLLSIPLWVVAWLVAIWAFQTTSFTAFEFVLLMLAAAGELYLLRRFLQTSEAKGGAPGLFRQRIAAAFGTPWPPLVTRSLALSALSAAYLQYYFWDVYLQIASLNTVVVFVPVRPIV